MMANRSIQISVTHTALGIFIGSVIEGLLPKFHAGASLESQVFETFVQVGVNGAALASVAGYFADNDPTSGLPFSAALYSSQPDLSRRIESLAAVVKAKVSQVSLRSTVPPLNV